MSVFDEIQRVFREVFPPLAFRDCGCAPSSLEEFPREVRTWVDFDLGWLAGRASSFDYLDRAGWKAILPALMLAALCDACDVAVLDSYLTGYLLESLVGEGGGLYSEFSPWIISVGHPLSEAQRDALLLCAAELDALNYTDNLSGAFLNAFSLKPTVQG